MRSIFHSFSTAAAAALLFISPLVGILAESDKQTNEIKAAVVPIGPNQLPEDAKLELAKAGVQQFLDEIVGELVSPTNSTGFVSQPTHSSEEEIAVRSRAFEKLAYVGNRSTVGVVASFLSDTTHPIPKPTGVRHMSYAEMAANALSQIVSNPPPAASFSAQDKIRAWQQWWEQNKDKYP